jgi:hypothetical protein
MELIVETKDFFCTQFFVSRLQLAGLDDLACLHLFYPEAIAFRWSGIVVHIPRMMRLIPPHSRMAAQPARFGIK